MTISRRTLTCAFKSAIIVRGGVEKAERGWMRAGFFKVPGELNMNTDVRC